MASGLKMLLLTRTPGAFWNRLFDTLRECLVADEASAE